MKSTQKMQNWNLINNEVVFKNYLFNISNKDFERLTEHDRHFIRAYGVNSIIKECYLEIKNNLPKNITSMNYLIEELKVPRSTLECWISGRNPIPIFQIYEILVIWKEVCKKSENKLNKMWESIFSEIKYFNCHGNKVKLPKKLTSELSYLIGLILADGYVKSDDKLLDRGKNPEYSICIYSESKKLLVKVSKIFKKLFGVNCNLHFCQDKKGSWYTLRCTSKPIHRFFCDVIGLQRGSKSGYVKILDVIKNAPIKIKKELIAGFFDGDGGIGISSKNPWLEIAQASYTPEPPNILTWIQETLHSNSVSLTLNKATYQNLWRLRTASKKTIRDFETIITSKHPNKIKKFQDVRYFSYGK